MKGNNLLLVLILMQVVVQAQHTKKTAGQNHRNASITSNKSRLIFQDDFNKDLKHWIVELAPTTGSSVQVKNNRLVMDVAGGATVWLNRELSTNIMITYNRKVIVDTGRNDRLSDLNQFWMATDPARKNLFTRTGVFSEYDSLLLYYVGFGGNSNTTTRFRKYTSKGERVLHHDLADTAHLLTPNKDYSIKIIVYKGVCEFYVDDRMYFSFRDEHPILKGYFGFRTTASRQEVDHFKVWQLE